MFEDSQDKCSNLRCSQPTTGPSGRCLTCNSLLLGALVRNRCLVKQLVSRGGFGTTYLVEDQDCFDEPRILKELRPASPREKDDSENDTANRKATAERLFKREAQTLLNLNHIGIPRLYAYFTESAYSYLLQEFIPGVNLAEAAAESGTTYSEEQARTLLREIAEILEYLHNQDPPIIHRDIKPQNLMRHSDGRLLLIDFGAVCRAANKASSQTLIGSPGYAPPEQAFGQPVPQSDLYAAGATIARLLTGIHPSQLTNMRTDRIEWQQHTATSEPFRQLLNRLLVRDVDLRIDSSSTILQRLKEMENTPPLPKGSRPVPIVSPLVNDPSTATIGNLASEQTQDTFDMGALMESLLVVSVPDILIALNQTTKIETGSLADTPIPSLLFRCYHSGLSGQLVLSYRGINKTIYFDQGTIVFASSSQREERLGEHLLNSKRISAQDLARATKIVDETGQRMGGVLLQLGIIRLEDLTPMVVEHVSHITYSVFDWTDGKYSFTEGQPVIETIKMPFSTADIIFEGIRRLDNLELIKQWLGDFTRLLCTTNDPLLLYQAVTLQPHEGYIVSRIDYAMSVEDLLSLGGLPENETLRTVCGLVGIGMLELAPKEETQSYKAVVANVLSQPNPLPQDLDFSTVAAFCYEVEGKLASVESSDAYGVLEVSRNASDVEISEAYTNLARKFHPDRNSQLLNYNISLKTELEKIFNAVSRAYEMLKNSNTRNQTGSSQTNSFSKNQIRNSSFSEPSSQVYARGYPNSEQTTSFSNNSSRNSSQPNRNNNPRSAQEWFEYGQSLYLEGRYVESRDALQSAIQIQPNLAEYHFYLARALSKLTGMFQSAELEFYRALELEQNNADYYAEFGLFYQRLNLKDRAEAMFSYCLSLSPNHPIALRSLRLK
ncbi:MAG: Zn finger domain-containing DnaJ-class molecular chaperone [bacterium]|nr:MAG: Zn finger domain-containing DnaJ-class molecular chaperone [bacterium]